MYAKHIIQSYVGLVKKRIVYIPFKKINVSNQVKTFSRNGLQSIYFYRIEGCGVMLIQVELKQ